VYNQAFEVGRLRDLARDFPEYAAELNNRIESHKRSHHTHSAPKHTILPACADRIRLKRYCRSSYPDLSYDGLSIGDGGAAMNAYERLMQETDTERIKQIRDALIQYCKLDTLAMVRILEVLEIVEK
jgi:hypothetical protein